MSPFPIVPLYTILSVPHSYNNELSHRNKRLLETDKGLKGRKVSQTTIPFRRCQGTKEDCLSNMQRLKTRQVESLSIM